MSPRVGPTSMESKNVELHESPHSLVPEAPHPENIPEVSSPITPTHTNALDTSVSYVLPFR